MQALEHTGIILVFLPLSIAVFVIGLAFNTLLLVLICKAGKVNNNTNVYLFSLGITGLMRTFVAFTLIVTLAARDWVLGKGICSINLILAKLLAGTSTLIFLAMSHDRYRAVKYPFTYWKVKRQITIIINIVIWIVSFILGIPGTVLNIFFVAQNNDSLWANCFISNGEVFAMQSPLAFLDILYIFLVTFSTGLTLIYYVLITKELHSIAKNRLHCTLSTETINTKDKPIECSVEKQTAQSLASFILFQSFCSAVAITLSSIVAVSILRFGGTANIQIVFCISLFFYILSAINPFLLMLTNKRFRKRVKDLLKWKIVPEYKELPSKKYGENTIVPI